jgi:hypothetical protein
MITTEMFHELLDDSKTDPVIFFEQMMGHLFCTKSNREYKRILKKIGEVIDEDRMQFGMKLGWK